MGWKDVAKLAGSWAEARKTELLTADRRTREDAAQQAERVEDDAQQEMVTSLLEKVLPPQLAEKVTAARPENVAARQAEQAAIEEGERRERLATMTNQGATATLTITLTGGEDGSATLTLPCQRTEEPPGEPEDDGPPALGWLRLQLEAADPVPVGSTTLSALFLGVPAYDGPGHYDLADLWAKGEAGEIGWWEALDIFLTPHAEADDAAWYVDVTSGAPATVDVADRTVRFDLPMASALSSIRATGTVTW